MSHKIILAQKKAYEPNVADATRFILSRNMMITKIIFVSAICSLDETK